MGGQCQRRGQQHGGSRQDPGSIRCRHAGGSGQTAPGGRSGHREPETPAQSGRSGGGSGQTWYERAELALKKGEEDLAREALSRRKTFQETATSLQGQVQSQDGQVESLKKNLVEREGKIAEAKTKKDML